MDLRAASVGVVWEGGREGEGERGEEAHIVNYPSKYNYVWVSGDATNHKLPSLIYVNTSLLWEIYPWVHSSL